MKRKKRLIRIVVGKLLMICFFAYMALLLYFLFFSEKYGRTNTSSSLQYNLVLFKEIHRYFEYYDVVGPELFMINIVGNVVAFIPFGFFVSVAFREQRKKVKKAGYFRWFLLVSFVGFLFSLSVETVQLVTKVGHFDVDDIFLNTIGVMLGYIVYYVSKKLIGRFR